MASTPVEGVHEEIDFHPAPPGLRGLQQRLEESAALTNWLAHDFGNTLTGVLGFAELLLGQLPAGSVEHDFVAQIQQSAQGGAEFLRRLLLFGRLTPTRSGVTQVGPVIAGEEVRLRPLWGPAVAWRVSVPTPLPSVLMGAEALREVLAQLLDNARHALGTGGTVAVTARPADLTPAACRELLGNAVPGAHVEVAVTDDGCGFSPEARRRFLTEPFFSTRPRHHGLGLPVVFGLLHSHRGGLGIEPAPGRGTVVRIFLPAAPPPEPHSV